MAAPFPPQDDSSTSALTRDPSICTQEKSYIDKTSTLAVIDAAVRK